MTILDTLGENSLELKDDENKKHHSGKSFSTL